jgi:hypothetical protein
MLARRRQETRLLLEEQIAELNAGARNSGMKLTADDQRDLDARLRPLEAELGSTPSDGIVTCPAETPVRSNLTPIPNKTSGFRTISSAPERQSRFASIGLTETTPVPLTPGTTITPEKDVSTNQSSTDSVIADSSSELAIGTISNSESTSLTL